MFVSKYETRALRAHAQRGTARCAELDRLQPILMHSYIIWTWVAELGLFTIPYYGYGRKSYGLKRVFPARTRTVQ
jgi:hypothetical protein